MADEYWAMIDGWAASSGSNPMDLSIDRFYNFIYYWATKDLSGEDRFSFDTRLWIPPEGEEPAPESPWSAENETKAFQAFKADFESPS
jgi:hypothetical protein